MAVKLCVPSDSGPVLFKVQSPAPSANAVPTVFAPSSTVTTALASAAPLITRFLSPVIWSPAAPVSFAKPVMTGASGPVVSSTYD